MCVLGYMGTWRKNKTTLLLPTEILQFPFTSLLLSFFTCIFRNFISLLLQFTLLTLHYLYHSYVFSFKISCCTSWMALFRFSTWGDASYSFISGLNIKWTQQEPIAIHKNEVDTTKIYFFKGNPIGIFSVTLYRIVQIKNLLLQYKNKK